MSVPSKAGRYATMIWTEAGVWLQTYDEQGQMQLSGCGKLSLVSVTLFCQEHGLDLLVDCPRLHRKPRLQSYGWSASLSPEAREEFLARGH